MKKVWACVILLSSLVNAHCMAGEKAKPKDFVEMSFDEAAKGLLIRSMPLKVALPAAYRMVKDQPSFGTLMWATPAAHDELQKKGSVDPKEGVFQFRLTTDIAYDLLKRQFFCGPECGEATLIDQMRSSGASDVSAEKYVVNEIPLLIVDAAMGEGAAATRVHLAYAATMISTNVVLMSYREPAGSPASGKATWLKFRETLLASGPSTKLELASDGDSQSIVRAGAGGEHGRMDGDRYIAPGNRFTIENVPLTSPETQLQEHFEGDAFTVAFSDDFGRLLRLDGGTLPNALRSKPTQEALELVFEKISMPTFRSASPDAAIIVARFAPTSLGGMLIRVVRLPGASTLAETNEKGETKRLDGHRAVVLFCSGGLMFQASAQETNPLAPRSESTEDVEPLIRTAVSFAESVRPAKR